MKVSKIDHVGIVVNDLAAAKAFFLALSFEQLGEGDVEGEWVERIIGLQNVKVKVAMLQTPDGEANIELVKFHNPIDENGVQRAFSNTLGIRHIALDVEDIEAVVVTMQENGGELVGKIQTYEDSYRLCYMRGPEEIILELAEKLR